MKEHGSQKAYNRTLPLVEQLEDVQRQVTKISTNPDPEDFERLVKLVEEGEHHILLFWLFSTIFRVLTCLRREHSVGVWIPVWVRPVWQAKVMQGTISP